MVDIATLGLEVRSDKVEKATGSLDRLTNAAKRAEMAALGEVVPDFETGA